MKRISLYKAIAASSSLLLLTSCGNSSLGGGADDFKTVWVSAVAASPRLESDVLSGNTCSATGSNGGTYTTDSVDVTVSSVKQSATGNALNVAIDKITITYTPINTSTPTIPDVPVSIIGNIIAPGGSVVIPVPVAEDIVKKNLVDKGLQTCSSAYFEYYVTIAFDIVELGTGERKSIKTSMNVAFADRAT